MKFLVIAIVLFSGLNVLAKDKAFLQGIDALYTLEDSIKLSAKVEDDSVTRRDEWFERVEFYKGTTFLGSARSYMDGVASIYTKKLGPGVHQIRAVMSHTSDYVGEDIFVVAIIDKNTKILVSDIDHTISDASGAMVASLPNRYLKPLDQSANFLHKLSKEYFIIYITARDDYFMKKSRDWLRMYRFPVGPSFYWDFQIIGGDPIDHGDYKSQLISRLKRKFKNIEVGVGDRPHDMRAYLENSMKAYYIGDINERPSRRSIIVNHWSEIYRDLTNQ